MSVCPIDWVQCGSVKLMSVKSKKNLCNAVYYGRGFLLNILTYSLVHTHYTAAIFMCPFAVRALTQWAYLSLW